MNGRLNVAIVLLGYLIAILLIILIIITHSTKKTEYDLSIPEEPIPLEERIEHDLDVKFEEWQNKVFENIEEVEEPVYLIIVTEEEKALMARVVMSEVGSDYIDFDIKQAVASTIVNRVRSGKWGETVTDVVTYPHAYWMGDNGEPTADCWEAVETALTIEAFPADMYYFKEGSYHDFGYPCMRIGNTYFSKEKAVWD